MKVIIKNIFVAALFIISVEALGFLSSFLAGDVKGVYDALVKPPLSPPPFVFGIVWSILYAMVGLSIFFVWKNKPKHRGEIYILNAIQLALNFLWSILFFRFKLFFAAMVDLVLIILFVAYLLYLYYKKEKVSFALLIPYLIWLLFALYLNIGFLLLN